MHQFAEFVVGNANTNTRDICRKIVNYERMINISDDKFIKDGMNISKPG